MEDDPNYRGDQAGIQVTGEGTCQSVPAESDEQKRQYDELNDRFFRLAADFENFRKRASREQERIMRFANEELAVDMLEVIDNLERAARSDDAHLRQGLEQIRQLFASVLQRHGITPIESLATAFDPTQHEAVAHIPSDKEEGIVVDEIARGYRMHDKIIRCAKVAVSKGNEKKTEN